MNESAAGIGDRVREIIEITALGIEVFAVVIIVVAVVHGSVRYLIHRKGIHPDEAYSSYRVQLGKALLVGLELLVAADIVWTVALNPTLMDVAILGFLVLIRTFLSWSLAVEIEGRWPWSRDEKPNSQRQENPS